MARKGLALVFILLIVGGVVVGGGIAADTVLRSTVGIGLFDIFNAVFQSSSTLENAMTLEDVKAEIGIAAYNNLVEQKANMTEKLASANEYLGDFNNNTELTGLLNAAFGAEYRIFLFSVTTVGNLTFKVFEWSIKLENGLVTGFEEGKIYDSYNVNVQAEQDVAYNIFTGNVDPELVPTWIKDNKLKINPITEVARFIDALPQVIRMIQSRA